MPRKIARLNALQVAKLSKPGYYPDGGNLYLQVAAGGSKSWLFRYTLEGKQREMGLGGLSAFSLAEARERAAEQRKLLADGIDPLTVKREKLLAQRMADANIITFNKAAAAYIEAHAPSWKNPKHRQQWENTLAQHAGPELGGLPVSRIGTPQIIRVLEPIWTTKNETASRLRGRIEQILDWATVRNYRAGDNPARWRGHLDKLLPKPSKVQKVQHHRALPFAQMHGFMADLRKREGMAARALEFVILTAARSGEVRGARWPEIDLEAGIWVVPGERMKAGREHRVPLSKQALALLEALPRIKGNDLVFPAPRGGVLSDMALNALVRRMEVDAVPHGFRSTFRDWCGESTNYPRDLAEQALAHTLESKVEAAYRRGDALEKRRQMMQAWADYCDLPMASGAVVLINRTA